MLVSYKIAAVPVAQCPTVSRAEASGSRDDGERGAAVDGAEVMLHVRCHVGVRWAEGRLAGPGRVRRQADEGDVRDDRAATQRRRPGKETETHRDTRAICICGRWLSPWAVVKRARPMLEISLHLLTQRGWLHEDVGGKAKACKLLDAPGYPDV